MKISIEGNPKVIGTIKTLIRNMRVTIRHEEEATQPQAEKAAPKKRGPKKKQA